MTIEKNNIDIPDYLNKEFFELALENGLNEKNVAVKKLNFTMGSAPGDNYTSQIYRVEVTYSSVKIPETNIFFIVKSMPKSKEREFIEIMDFYGKETEMYFEQLPKMNGYLHGKKFNAKCYYACEEPLQTLVFDDLKQLGYRTADREKGLNEAHVRVVLNKLGKFHAISMILLKQESKISEKFKTGPYNADIDTKIFYNFFIGSLKGLISSAKHWKGYESIVEKLEILKDKFIEKLQDNTTPRKDDIKVLIHGDLWTNNFLFQYESDDSEIPLDIAFVDYQGSYYVSPGIDINYFLNSSVELDILKSRREYVIEEYYYKSLQSTLEENGYENIPTLEDIMNEIHKKEFFGFFAASYLLPIVAMDRVTSSDNSLEGLLDENAMKLKLEKAFSSKRVSETLHYVLRRADKLGLLDC